MKTCKHCNQSLPISDFYQRNIGIPYTLCKTCYNEDRKKRDSVRTHKEVLERVCATCKEIKPTDQFHKNRSGLGGLSSHCKYCTYLRHIQKKYGITNIQELIDERNGLCDICKEPFDKKPHIDHDHECCPGVYTCGKCFRGLLCQGCNQGLGNFKNSKQALIGAAKYLE